VVAPEINGAAAISAAVAELHPGQGHARHNHPEAEEVIHVLSGTGEQMVEDEAGRPITWAVTPGATVYVPRARYHATLNTGPGPMRIFVTFAPAGSQDELRRLPDFRLIPPGG
jgi:oxalate decarboxylase/phosphoglucose isomerase-like protein (cupin superfamily)